MSINLSRSINLGSFENIIFVCNLIGESQKAIPVRDLKTYCLRRSIDLAYSIDGILDLLTFVGWCKSEGGNLMSSGDTAPLNISGEENNHLLKQRLIYDIFSSLKKHDILMDFIDLNSIDYDIARSRLGILNNSIPISASGLKNLLISIGVFQLVPDKPYIYYIDEDYQEYFETDIIGWLREKMNYVPDSGLTYDEFREIQRIKEEVGNEAEEYVVNFEKRRLVGHPSLLHIKQISKIKINAGYDIISFNSTQSERIDRFIEVKSFTVKPKFFWSKNEIEMANTYHNKYFLYLVDRDKISDSEYQPMIYPDPYNTVFVKAEWGKEPMNWYFWKQ